MNRVGSSGGTYELTEVTTPPCKSGNGGIDTNAHRDAAEHNQRDGHRGRSLVGRVMLVGFLVLGSPEDAVIKTEHVEGGHGGNAGHNPTNPGAVLKAGGNNLILRAETREERNTGNGQTADEERDVRYRQCVTGMYLRRPPIKAISLE